jgi:SNF2 family DNA or RNA helicase
MTCGVYAELAADGQSIIIAATGDDWEIDRAAKALRRLTPLLEKTEPAGMLRAPATWATITQLGYTFNSDAVGQWIPMPRLKEWITGEFLRRHITPSPFFTLPPGLTPRQYQARGAAEISAAGKFLLFDEPGCGKTVTTILGLLSRQQEHELFPMVIVVPSWDVADVWVRHIKEWAPGWPDPSLYGGPERHLYDLSGISITTYATATLDAANASGPLVKLKAKTVVADEAHYLKNEKAQRTYAIQRVAAHAGTFIALTGTPITRDTGDIFPVLAAMDPETYPARGRFVKRYLDTTDDGYGEVVEGLKALAEPEFRAALAGQYRRVAKNDVLDQLPPKIYSVRRTEIPPAWRKAYDSMEQDMLAELPDGGELPVMSVLAQLTRLGQLASSACDVAVREELDMTTGELKKHYEVTLKAPSWKADALKGILDERPGQQVAVFANSKQLIGIAGYAIQHKYRCGYITGGQGQKERHDAIEKFQAGQLDVILCTAGAGGLGITLTAAGTVVFLQRSWELDKAVQPEDRAHRIGQEHDRVEIIDIVAKDTVDDRVRELMRVKGGHLGQLVQDPRIVRELLGGLR